MVEGVHRRSVLRAFTAGGLAVGLSTTSPSSAAKLPAALAMAADDLVGYETSLPWFAALSNRRNQSVNVAFIGDSTVEGFRLDAMAQTLPQQLGYALRSGFPVPGVGGGRGYIGVQSNMVSHPFWPAIISGGAIVYMDAFSPSLRRASLESAGHKVTFTVAKGGITSFDIVQIKTSAGAAEGAYYSLDGGNQIPLSTYVSSGILADVMHVSANVSATIEIGWKAGKASICGISEYNGDESSGVRVHNFGFSGTSAANWAKNAPPNGSWVDGIKLFRPDAVIIELGANDARIAGGNMSATAFKTNMTTIVSAIRGRSISCPVILSMTFDPNLETVDPWSAYVTAASEIASTDPTVGFIDHTVRMPKAATGGIGLYNDKYLPHASAKGYGLMAETLRTALAPR